MENLRIHVNTKIVRSSETNDIRCLVATPLFARHETLRKDLAGIQPYKSKLLLNKPVCT